MTTRISHDGPATSVSVAPTAFRVTPKPATPFKSMLNASTVAVLNGAESAVRRLPGGEVLAAAVRPGLSGPTFASPGISAGVGGTSAVPTDASGTFQSALPEGSIEGAISQQSQEAMKYLGYQLAVQEENRTFTTFSNCLKARHDTVKNTISNFR